MKPIKTPFGNMPIIYEDKHMLAVSKPHGLHSVEDRHKVQTDTLRSILDDEYGKIYIVHRLDAGTGGVMLCAKTPKMHAFLNKQFEQGRVKKEYLAVTEPHFDAAVTVMLPISPKIAHGKYKINFKSGKPARTSFIPLSYNDKASLVRALPHTGRTHQIRVHLRAHKYPLITDWVYNKQSEDRRLPLQSSKIEFEHPVLGMMSLEAPLSDYMTEELEKYGLSL